MKQKKENRKPIYDSIHYCHFLCLCLCPCFCLSVSLSPPHHLSMCFAVPISVHYTEMFLLMVSWDYNSFCHEILVMAFFSKLWFVLCIMAYREYNPPIRTQSYIMWKNNHGKYSSFLERFECLEVNWIGLQRSWTKF